MNKQNQKIAFLLWHTRESMEDEDVKLIGIYSEEIYAIQARKRIERKPGFCDFPEGFSISRKEINRDYWTDGFIIIINELEALDRINSESENIDVLPKYYKQMQYSPSGYAIYNIIKYGLSSGYEIWRLKDHFLVGLEFSYDDAIFLALSERFNKV